MRTFLLLFMLFWAGIVNAQYSKKDGAVHCLALAQPVDWYPNGDKQVVKVENKFAYVIFFKDRIVITDEKYSKQLSIQCSNIKDITTYQIYEQDDKNYLIIDAGMTTCSYVENSKTIFMATVNFMKTLALMDVLGIISMEK